MALQSLTTDTRNPVLGRIGQGPAPDMPGLPHLNELGDDIGVTRSNELGDPLPAASSTPALQPLTAPVDPLQQRKSEVEADLERRMNPTKPTSVLGKIGHGFATAGNILGDIFAPSTMALIPGTQLNNEVKKGQDRSQLGEISKLETEQTGRKQTEANTDYLQQKPEIEQAKVQQHLTTSLAPKGFNITRNPNSPGGFDIEQDPNSPYTQKLNAATALQQAQTEREQVLSQMGQPGSPLYEQKQRQLDQIDQRIHASLAGLGLRKEMLGVLSQRNAIQADRLGFDEDKTYNPEPTAQERTKGDLASSAVDRISEMKQIVAKHPEYFGPVAGRAQNAQAWLGSSDPDAVTYNTAAQYLADHSAGVFGGRGQYITQALHGLTNPKYTPEGLNAALDEADRAARGFVKAGTTHAKGKQGNAAAQANPEQKVKTFNPKTGRLE